MTDENIRANRAFGVGLRAGIESSLGNVNSFRDSSGDKLRNHYDVFGWPTDPTEEDYLALYLRNAFARVVVDKPAFTTWRDVPTITDTDTEDESEFEQTVTRLEQNFDIWNYASRTDRVAGVGEHGLLAIGFSDVEDDMAQWAEDARNASLNSLDAINTFKPILQTQISDIDYGGPDSERWGEPVSYSIDWTEDISEGSEGEEGPSNVHWTRVIDVPATTLLDDETLARPRVEPVLNNLLDIEKTLGSSTEQSYRGADYGLHLNFDPEKVDPNSIDTDEMRDEFERWYHGLQPEFKTVGGELNTLGGEMQDPSGIVENNLKAIYAQTGIPKREFIGNSQGEQAGAQQDEKSYFGMIAERREHYANRHLVRPLIQRFITVDILPTPANGLFEIDWPDLTQLSEAEKADTQAQRASVVQAVPGIAGETAIQYVKHGATALPEADTTSNIDLDESNPAVQEQFADGFLEELAADD